MSAVVVFLSGIVVTMGVVYAALHYLKGPLQAILTDLCGTEDRARFWTAFSNITLFLVPFAVVLSCQPDRGSLQNAIFEISSQIEFAIIGFVISILLLGFVLSRYIPHVDLTRPDPSKAH